MLNQVVLESLLGACIFIILATRGAYSLFSLRIYIRSRRLVVVFVVIPARTGTSTNFKSFWRRVFVWKITLEIEGLFLLIC